MTDSAAVPTRTPGRRTVRYSAPADVLADVDRLRRGGYRKVGQWTLPQACHHLATVISGNLTPPPNDDPPTPEQLAMKAKFFGMVQGGMPEGIPSGATTPPQACDDTSIDALAAAFAALDAYPHARLMVGRCGPVPTDEVRQLHLLHCAHHLSFLVPTSVRRTLAYRSLDELIADVERLRQGYARLGNWTLEQICWHLRTAFEWWVVGVPVTDPTPEMIACRPRLEPLLAGQPYPSGMPTLPQFVPPPDPPPAEVDRFLAFVRDLQANPPPRFMHRGFGPLTGDEATKLFLCHCGNHFSNLVPDPTKEKRN
jgi:hypothetical protein